MHFTVCLQNSYRCLRCHNDLNLCQQTHYSDHTTENLLRQLLQINHKIGSTAWSRKSIIVETTRMKNSLCCVYPQNKWRWRPWRSESALQSALWAQSCQSCKSPSTGLTGIPGRPPAQYKSVTVQQWLNTNKRKCGHHNWAEKYRLSHGPRLQGSLLQNVKIN